MLCADMVRPKKRVSVSGIDLTETHSDTHWYQVSMRQLGYHLGLSETIFGYQEGIVRPKIGITGIDTHGYHYGSQ